MTPREKLIEKVMNFTPAEINHILSLLYFEKQEESYFGNKAHHYKRRDGLIKKFEQLRGNSMTNTKAYNEAVEVLGMALLDRVYQGDLPISYSDAHRVFTELAKTAIDALGVEIVSRESELRETHEIVTALGFSEASNMSYSLVCDVQDLKYMKYDIESLEIIQRNNKPAVYVETIKKNIGK